MMDKVLLHSSLPSATALFIEGINVKIPSKIAPIAIPVVPPSRNPPKCNSPDASNCSTRPSQLTPSAQLSNITPISIAAPIAINPAPNAFAKVVASAFAARPIPLPDTKEEINPLNAVLNPNMFAAIFQPAKPAPTRPTHFAISFSLSFISSSLLVFKPARKSYSIGSIPPNAPPVPVPSAPEPLSESGLLKMLSSSKPINCFLIFFNVSAVPLVASSASSKSSANPPVSRPE